MEISNNNYKLLAKMLNGEIVSVSDSNLQKKSFLYSLEKVNEFLDSFELPPITTDADRIVIPDEVKKSKETILTKSNHVFLNYEDRIQACELLIECESKPIYLKDYMSIFGVSKNTAFNDVKDINQKLNKDNLTIDFTRKDGYVITGNELVIRKRINYILESLFFDLEKTGLLELICNVTKEQLQISTKVINDVEKELEIHFVESKTSYMPYLLSIYVNRINNGNRLNNDSLFFNELNDTFEFNTVYNIVNKTYNLENDECYYISLLLLSTSIAKFNLVNSELKNDLSDAIYQVINSFEINACIAFDEKEKLHRNILQHMIAAYYRIKYDLTLSKEMIAAIQANTDNQEFQLVEGIVEKSIAPLQSFIEADIPAIEKHFLVLQFLAWIRRQNLSPLNKPRAVVVCLNGVTISNLMFLSLRELFPEFTFVDVVSLRDFNELDEKHYDIVFSTISLKTNKKLFLVNNIIEFKDKNSIRNRVFAELYDQNVPKTDLGIIYKTIDENLPEDQAVKLKTAIAEGLQSNNSTAVATLNNQPSLLDLITINRIAIINSVVDYKEAIRLAAKPLLKEEIITNAYIEKIITNYDFNYPNIVFGTEIAVPHASAEDGSNALAMSLLKINNGVKFGKDCLVHVVVMLAPIDTSSHLKALIQLSNLAMNDDDVKELAECTNKNEIQNILKKHNK